jgi:alpha-mannosidase
MYEAGGGARRALLRTSARVVEAWQTNMLERDPRPIGHDEHSVPLAFRPFEITTVKLALQS